MDDPKEAKDKWRTARSFWLQGNKPAISGGLVAALAQFAESYLLAASAMARQGLPVSVGTGIFTDTTAYHCGVHGCRTALNGRPWRSCPLPSCAKRTSPRRP